MVRQATGTYWIVLLVFLASHGMAEGQYFLRHRNQPTISNSACGMTGCPPRVLSYGYYHENWRRWPEEQSSEVPDGSLTPFVIPDRELSAPFIPEPRDEATQVQRRRTPIQATPQDADTSSMPSAPARQPSTPTLPSDSGLPSDLPGDTPSGSFFPGEDSTDNVFPNDTTEPGGLPGLDEGDNLFSPDDAGLPGEEPGLPGADESDALPGSDDGEIDFDPLDLGLNEPGGKHAARELLGTGPSAQDSEQPRKLQQVSARDITREVDVDLRRSSNRGNPLRERSSATQVQTASQLAPATVHHPTFTPRSNPLRRR